MGRALGSSYALVGHDVVGSLSIRMAKCQAGALAEMVTSVITCFGEVAQGAAEGAPLQPLPHGVGVVQAGTVHTAVTRLLLQARALGYAGPHHPLLLLQLRCGAEQTHTTRCEDYTGSVFVSVCVYVSLEQSSSLKVHKR